MRTKLSVRAENFQPQRFAKIALAATLGLAITFTLSCSSDDGGGVDKGNDIGNYRTVQIGNQKWMAENLNYNVSSSKCYGEGGQVQVGYDEETDTKTFTTLSNAEVQANCDKYGRLYDWATAMDWPSNCNETSCTSQTKHRGICPSGWHIPSNADWETLIDYIETQKSCTDCAGRYLKATKGWSDNGNGTDAFDFAALPGGLGDSDGDYFLSVGNYGIWWSTTEGSASYAYFRGVGYSYEGVKYDDDFKDRLFSVRCLQD
jgi:uncharacterized protein (TIGR02145 family)